MPEISKELELPVPDTAITPADKKRGYIKCLVCGGECHQAMEIKEDDGKSTFWISCLCGCVFHTAPRGNLLELWPDGYKEVFQKSRWLAERYDLLVRMYVPMIEELTNGRKFLDIGFTMPAMINRMTERGWIGDGIDLNKNDFLTGDFADFVFGMRKYDFILMNDILQCFDMPVLALRKAQKLLNPNGILLIMTPDTEAMMLIDNPSEFGQFRFRPNRVLWSKRQLEKTLTQMGMELLVSRRSLSGRLFSPFSMHIIAQKDAYGASEIEEIDRMLEEKT